MPSQKDLPANIDDKHTLLVRVCHDHINRLMQRKLVDGVPPLTISVVICDRNDSEANHFARMAGHGCVLRVSECGQNVQIAVVDRQKLIQRLHEINKHGVAKVITRNPDEVGFHTWCVCCVWGQVTQFAITGAWRSRGVRELIDSSKIGEHELLPESFRHGKV